VNKFGLIIITYVCGHVALRAFQSLLEACQDRRDKIEPRRLEDQRVRLEQVQAERIFQIPENSTFTASSRSSSNDQDLSNTLIPPAEAENLEQFQRLQAYAAHLSSLHRCDLHAPSWVLKNEHSPISLEHSPMSQDARRMFG
jgi:hypothetical protein